MRSGKFSPDCVREQANEGSYPRLYSPDPVANPSAFRSVGFRLPRGALPHSPLVALPPDPCEEDQSPSTPTLAFAR